MLILSRRIGEIIYINDNIKIYYLGESNFCQGKLGFEAPPDVQIYREEIYLKLKEQLLADKRP